MTLMTEVNDYLEHYGIKGMQWGVRRQQKRLAKADKKWEKNINTVPTYIAVHNRAADLSNNLDIDRINSMPKFKNRSMNDENDPVTKAYFKAHENAFNKRMKQAAEEIIGTNPSGTKRINIDLKTGETTLVDVEHANSIDNPGRIVVEFDELHQIKRFVVVPSTNLTQAEMDETDEFLAHHGVKGMKWGVRRKGSGSSRPGGRTTYQKPAARLSDAELNRRIKRMELEKRYADLNAPTSTRGKKFTESFVEKQGHKLATTAVTAAIGLAVKSVMKEKNRRKILVPLSKMG